MNTSTDIQPRLKNPKIKSKRGRGRPRGTTDHPDDHKLLSEAARLLAMRLASSRTSALKVVAEGNDTTVRRLQRKWKDFEKSFHESEERRRNARWDFELESLRKSLPRLYARVVRFAASRVGKARLRRNADATGAPLHPMSLGMVALFELIEAEERKAGKNRKVRLYPVEVSLVDQPHLSERRFQNAIEGWIDGGFEVSSESMRELARRCDEFADELQAGDELKHPHNEKKCDGR